MLTHSEHEEVAHADDADELAGVIPCDYRVPYVEGLQIYNAYRARGLPARLVVYPGENHWILARANSLHWYGEVLDWLDRWLGDGSEGEASA